MRKRIFSEIPDWLFPQGNKPEHNFTATRWNRSTFIFSLANITPAMSKIYWPCWLLLFTCKVILSWINLLSTKSRNITLQGKAETNAKTSYANLTKYNYIKDDNRINQKRMILALSTEVCSVIHQFSEEQIITLSFLTGNV